MKTSLDHLPRHKQEEIKDVTQLILKANFDFRPELIILFGSYARGDWVEDRYQDEQETTYEYKSDYDLLIIVEKPEQVHFQSNWRKLQKSIQSWNHIKTPINFIEEDIETLNKALSEGQYFYSDIQKEGVLLYNSNRFELAEIRHLHTNERRQKAKEHFDHWFREASEFQQLFVYCSKNNLFKKAALMLHQQTECLYTTILLVFTDYRPKTHDLERLGILAASQVTKVGAIFPKSTQEQKRRFELLKSSYVESRYRRDFKIKKEDLEWLAIYVDKLQILTIKVCKKKIESFVV